MEQVGNGGNEIFYWVEEEFGNYIWGVANRYKIGIWAKADVYQEILIRTVEALQEGKIDFDEDGRIRSFIITRAIDIVRREKYRQGTTWEQIQKKARRNRSHPEFALRKYDMEPAEIDPPSTDDEAMVEFETEIVREIIRVRLPAKEARFIEELVFPSQETIDLAVTEQAKKRADVHLRMGSRTLIITTNHVAQRLKSEFGHVISPATISRYKEKARETLRDLLDI